MRRVAIGFALALLAVSGCSGGDTATVAPLSQPSTPGAFVGPQVPRTKPVVTVPKGNPPATLQVIDLIEGTGRAAVTGDNLSVKYVGLLFKNGKQFDSSWETGQPLPFQLGAQRVIPGWDKGILGMRVGGRRELIIPPDLAYGAGGQGDIGPNETLVFVIDLLSAEPGPNPAAS